MALKKNKEGKIKDTKTNKQKLKDKAWNVFSTWIRRRDNATCVTCGHRNWDSELGEWSVKGFNAGHFWHAVLDFDEENINCQCIRCNHHLSGNLAPYSVYLLNKLGKEKFDKLAVRKSMAQKGELQSIEYYQRLIEKYSSYPQDNGYISLT